MSIPLPADSLDRVPLPTVWPESPERNALAEINRAGWKWDAILQVVVDTNGTVLDAEVVWLPELTSTSPGGDRSIVRWSPLRQRVADVWDRYRAAALQEIPDDGTQRRYARLFDQDLPLLEHVPVASTLLIDTEGNMWIERYRLPWEEDPVWDVIDASGHWLGTVNTPRRFNLFDIGPDYVLGRHRDDLGVERIRLYTLHR